MSDSWIDEFFDEMEAANEPLSFTQESSLHSLLDRSSISPERKELILLEIDQATQEDLPRLFSILIESQVDPITSGLNYTQTDIKKHLCKLITKH